MQNRWSQNLRRPGPHSTEVIRPLVLVVDDEERIQQMTVEAVEELGYVAVAAGNGAEGLALARQYLPDLILADALMPKLDGREMCRLLKEDPATSHIKLVLVTGLYTATRYRTEALYRFHADDYITKPMGFHQLHSLLQRYLG